MSTEDLQHASEGPGGAGRSRVGPPASEEDVTSGAAADIDLDDPSLYVNRELSLLAFQERVLEEAEDPSNPLLERLKFLAILSSNLAEFAMVRLSGLKQQVRAGVGKESVDGLTPAEQLSIARETATDLVHRGRRLWAQLRRDLAHAGIFVHDYADLDAAQRSQADSYFTEDVFPALTPLAFDPGRPFPHISNLSLNLAVLVRMPDGDEHFARVKIPRSLPRLVPVGSSPSVAPGGTAREHHFVPLDQLVGAHLEELFPGVEIVAAHPFRVTRDAELAIQELEADDLLDTIEDGLRRRRFGSVVRVTVTPDMPDRVRKILVENLEIAPEDMVVVEPPLGMSDLIALSSLDRPDLRYADSPPALVPGLEALDETDVFAAIREHDILIHRPFESFEPVVALIRQAATDPAVLAIKITLYRVGRDSPIVQALLDAAENGKEVAALVELKARFDEESNIEWARRLERKGVHVVYGFAGLKTHCKVALIVRREKRGIVRYVHVGTGNYNVVTARQYTDLDLMTRDEAIGADASRLFNSLTGYSDSTRFDEFAVAPATLRSTLEERIRGEMEHARAGRSGRMILKANGLVDRRLTRLLYEASSAGVEIDLIIRGICQIRPGIPDVSDTIRVRSIVGRYLEHSRIYYFENAGDPVCLVGSGDLMTRNLDHRVEVLAPVKDPSIRERLRNDVLGAYLADNMKARIMQPDGSYVRATPGPGEEPVDAQEELRVRAVERGAPL